MEYTNKTHQIYVHKVVPHDISHQYSINSELVSNFFDNQDYLTFYRADDEQFDHPYQVKLLRATDPRFNSQFPAIFSQDRVSSGDLLLINKLKNGQYTLMVIKKSSSVYDVFNDIYKEGNDRHAVYLDGASEENQEEDEESVSNNNKLSFDIASDDLEYINALKAKPFMILAGNSGTGKSRIVKRFAYMTCPQDLRDTKGVAPGNYCMIEVKPNWHDSSDLLGYYSSLLNSYVITAFDKFVVKAWLNPTVPFFVCLDEMNLAPVEQYFAEFLSVIETRQRKDSIEDEDNDDIVTGAIIKKEYFKENLSVEEIAKGKKNIFEELGLDFSKESDCDLRDMLKEDGLTLPPNLFVIGTVNMDDTTYQFSRKVIDRAMTIEMNGGNLKGMFGNSSQMKYQDDLIDLDNFKSTYLNADEVIQDFEKFDDVVDTIKNIIPEKLDALNTILKDTPFQVSYRVLNELAVYYGVLMDRKYYEKNKEIEKEDISVCLDKAFDDITIMKILPRIEGDSDMFVSSDETTKDNKLKQLQALFSAESKSYKKLEEMNRRLEASDFTRFWP